MSTLGDEDEDGPYGARLARLRGALQSLVEEIDELVFDLLQEAATEGRGVRPALERHLTRARNGLERALRQLEVPPQEPPGSRSPM